MMVYLLLNYDIETETPGVVPEPKCIGAAVIPDRTARLRLRRREAAF